MKIGLISNLYPPIARGGAEKVAERVARGFADAGHEVFVISTKPWSGWESLKPAAAEENGIKIYRFYPLNFFYYLNDYKYNAVVRLIWHFFDIFNFQSRRVVKKILKKEKPDVVMTHNLKGIGYLVPRAIRRLGIKHIHVLHDLQLSVPSGLIIKGQEKNWQQTIFLRKWYEAICQWLFASPDAVISPSKWYLDFHNKRGFFKNSKKIVLPNPVGLRQDQAINNYSPSESFDAAQDKLRESKGLQLLYLGHIEEHKGILFLIKTLKQMDGGWQLHIVGDGSKMEEVKKMVAGDDRFVIYGWLTGKPLEDIFGKVDLTIVPSLWYENSPNVICESFAFGVPVLAAKIGGAAELIRDGENGFTFLAGGECASGAEAEDLKRVLRYCLEHRDELQKMRLAAQKSVEDFGVENYIKKILTLV